MTNPFILTHVEKDSPLWNRLMGYLDARLKRLRIENDADRTPEQTAKIDLQRDLAQIDAHTKQVTKPPVEPPGRAEPGKAYQE